MVHRDLKPENILSTEQGLFKVLDLGLAREFGRDLDWSGFSGTPAYAAPEQASGLPCDGRADQYALALVAFELLAGRRLFLERDPDELLKMHREAEPAALATELVDAPEAVRMALVRALSKDPNARFATCGDLAVALGCQFLSAPTPTPEILMETDVERMTAGWLVHWASLPWHKNAVHLALTREALWAAYHTEVRRWSLSVVERIEPRSNPDRDGEASIRGIYQLHVIALILILLALTVLAGLLGGPDAWLRPTLVAMGVLAAFGTWFYVVSRGLQRLRSWARWAAFIDALVVLVMAAVVPATLVAVSHTPGLPVHLAEFLSWGILLSPVIAAAAYVAWILTSRKASALFTPSYRRAANWAPNLDPKGVLRLESEWRPTLRLTLRVADDRLSGVAFRFSDYWRCKEWGGRIAALAGRPADSAATGSETAPTEPNPIVLLRQRPTVRYQLLGTVESKGYKRRTAEGSLLVRAAMMGADAVVNLREEFLPDFSVTVLRLTGMAVRAVDAEGRFEFRSRWYADRASRINILAIGLMLIDIALQVMNRHHSARIDANFESIIAGATVGPLASKVVASESQEAILTISVIAAIHIWPIGLAILARGLRWPQLVRPLALALVAFALQPVYTLTGLVAAALLSRAWPGLIYHSLLYLDPLNLALLMFGLFLGQAAWRADREFRRILPDTKRKVPIRRSLGGYLAMATSVAYTTILACFIMCGGFLNAIQVRLPTAANLNNLAWLFVVAPGRSTEQTHEAVILAERAVELKPEGGNIWNTLR